jgi:hypothetical protein
MNAEQLAQHQWLQRLVGEWTWESPMGGKVHRGAERVRSLGGVWVICEGKSAPPEGGTAETIMTLGYDPQKGRFVGTFLGSMMTNLWIYDGSLDEEASRLTLDTEGPSFTEQGKILPYKDVIELRGDDERLLTSYTRGDDGEWTEFMTATYRRVK